jgi:hypothetical protein
MSANTQTLPTKWPKWIRDIARLLPIRSQFVLSGNIRDVFLMPTADKLALAPLLTCLWSFLESVGYEFAVIYDRIDGVRVHPPDTVTQTKASEVLELKLQDGFMPATPETLTQIAKRLVANRTHRGALLIDFASRLTPSPESPEPSEYRFYSAMEKLSLTANPLVAKTRDAATQVPMFNPVFWLVNRPQDLPSWYQMDSERISAIVLEQPDYETRMLAAETLGPLFPTGSTAEARVGADFGRMFADETDGMTLRAMADIAQIARLQGITWSAVGDAVRCFKIGQVENPWRKDYLRDKIRFGAREIEDRVKGQHQAVVKTMDILLRSVMGLTGAQVRATGGRPRGVLFFAGPTGVGKTELAKSLTGVLFGDERSYVRFDMSEFSEEHAAARLLGAPPGYVGYEAGGELTNALRRRPFSVVLFDEIEKCHPRLLDKFLQILEDGRLTDGQGNTVYFSECVIIFTSNLGVVIDGEDGLRQQNVSSTDPYEVVEERIRKAIEEHFKFRLGRPELLNRIGDNIVVFNFISRAVGEEILGGMLRNVARRIKTEHDLDLEFSESARAFLSERCLSDLTNGGRGIGNRLESVLINPIARALFDRSGRPSSGSLVVNEISETAGVFSVVIA